MKSSSHYWSSSTSEIPMRSWSPKAGWSSMYDSDTLWVSTGYAVGGLFDFTTKGLNATGSLAGDTLLVNIVDIMLPPIFACIFYFNLLAISWSMSFLIFSVYYWNSYSAILFFLSLSASSPSIVFNLVSNCAASSSACFLSLFLSISSSSNYLCFLRRLSSSTAYLSTLSLVDSYSETLIFLILSASSISVNLRILSLSLSSSSSCSLFILSASSF